MSVSPRAPLLNPALQRPDWQRSVPRPPGTLWLDKNENLDPVLMALSERVLREIKPMTLATYPECGELYRKLADSLGVTPQGLLLTPGSDGAIRLTFEAFVSEGDAVVHTDPTFAMYPVYSQMFGAKTLPIAYERGADGPELSVERLRAHLTAVKPRLFCLPNPDSPTGTVVEPDALESIIELCGKQDTVVLIDEAYHPFYDRSVIPLTLKHRHLIVARTFAKAWGLAGLRIGYAVAHPDTMKYIDKLRPMYEVSTISVAVMEAMMDHIPEVQASVGRLTEGKRRFVSEMEALGFATLPSHGNFCHVAFGDRASAVHEALDGRVLYRKDFKEPCLSGYSRFSATTPEKAEPIIEAIRSAAGSVAV